MPTYLHLYIEIHIGDGSISKQNNFDRCQFSSYDCCLLRMDTEAKTNIITYISDHWNPKWTVNIYRMTMYIAILFHEPLLISSTIYAFKQHQPALMAILIGKHRCITMIRSRYIIRCSWEPSGFFSKSLWKGDQGKTETLYVINWSVQCAFLNTPINSLDPLSYVSHVGCGCASMAPLQAGRPQGVSIAIQKTFRNESSLGFLLQVCKPVPHHTGQDFALCILLLVWTFPMPQVGTYVSIGYTCV